MAADDVAGLGERGFGVAVTIAIVAASGGTSTV